MELKRIVDRFRPEGPGRASRKATGAAGTLGLTEADLDRVADAIGTCQKTADRLWKTGVREARHLATRVADTGSAARSTILRWGRETSDEALAGVLAGFVARTPHAARCAQDWCDSAGDRLAELGWQVQAERAREGRRLRADEARRLLARIEADIVDAAPPVRAAMHECLVAIGRRDARLRAAVRAAAGRIGAVRGPGGKTLDAASELAPRKKARAKTAAPKRKKKKASRA